MHLQCWPNEMKRGHSLSLTVNNSSAMQMEPNCEKGVFPCEKKNNYEELKMSHVRKAKSTDIDEE